MTNKDLRSVFLIANHRFFDDTIPEDYVVRFEKMKKDDGYHIREAREICINSDFINHPDMATLVLLHEMAHASLPDYVGWAQNDVHGTLFQAKLHELMKKGAYDDLL